MASTFLDQLRKRSRKKQPSERTAAAIALRERMLDGCTACGQRATHHDHVRWLLAYLIDWHHREEKAEWWEFFRLRELPEEDLFDEPKAIAGLRACRRDGTVSQQEGQAYWQHDSPISVSAQEVELAEGDKLRRQDDKPFGEVLALDRLGAHTRCETRKGSRRSSCSRVLARRRGHTLAPGLGDAVC